MAGREFRYLRHEAAAADTPLDESLGMELDIGRFYRIARHAKRFGQRARGRQRLAGTERTVKDELSDGSLYPGVERHRCMRGMCQPCLHGFQLRMLEQLA